jgi:hypothetical protein
MDAMAYHDTITVGADPHLVGHHEVPFGHHRCGTTSDTAVPCASWSPRTQGQCGNESVVLLPTVDRAQVPLCGGHFIAHRRGTVLRLIAAGVLA